MCGRYSLYSSEDSIVAHFALRQGFSMRTRYNIAPSQTVPVITQWGKSLEFYRWGFIPPWTKTTENTLPTGFINARWETLSEKVTFKKAFHSQRCLIPANGYYEWRAILGKKQPFYIHFTHQPLFAFAGIWSTWQTPQGILPTCAIITAPASPFLQDLHPRMPLVISPEHYRHWLAPTKESITESALWMDIPEDKIQIYPVSVRMNHPQFDGIECIRALTG